MHHFFSLSSYLVPICLEKSWKPLSPNFVQIYGLCNDWQREVKRLRESTLWKISNDKSLIEEDFFLPFIQQHFFSCASLTKWIKKMTTRKQFVTMMSRSKFMVLLEKSRLLGPRRMTKMMIKTAKMMIKTTRIRKIVIPQIRPTMLT